jgi:hypothetical protein
LTPETGWLAGLRDRFVGRAWLMHHDPVTHGPWTSWKARWTVAVGAGRSSPSCWVNHRQYLPVGDLDGGTATRARNRPWSRSRRK